MKKIGLLFLIVFLVSCGLNTNNSSIWINTQTWTENYSQTWTENTNSGENLSDNNVTQMQTKQTQWLQNGDIVAIMKTDNGTIKIKLFTELVPATTTNFIALSKKGYYNGVTFHRVIKDFMIQWWDPKGTGMWGESVYSWSFDDEFTTELSNIPYSLSMANSWPNTNWSQFFINQWNNVFLDFNKEPLSSKHSVFWQVVEGKEAVDKISKVKTWTNGKPEKDIKIISVEIKQYENGKMKDYSEDINVKVKEIETQMKAKKDAKKTKSVEKGDTISVNYTWTYDSGEKFDSSYDRKEPISFQVWAWQMIPWFDAWVIWMKIWEKKTLNLDPKDAYWEKEVVLQKSDLKSFADAWVELKAWSVLPTAQWEIKILKADDKTITVENISPMAWQNLNFDIELMDIK